MSRTSTDSSSRPDGSPRSDVPAVPERPEDIRRVLAALDVTPRRVGGQSFLTDPFVADAEAALVGARTGAGVLEVGGGLGILTAALLRRGVSPLTVVEKDPKLAAFLRSVFDHRITVVEGDALEVPMPPVDAVVGNLPFSVATPLLLRFLPLRVPRLIVLLQREVAERLAAGPGSRTYGRLSILARLYGEVELFQPVPATAFFPVPAVAGQLLVLTARSGPLPVTSVERTEGVVRQLFRSRRKQLGNLLPSVTPSGETPEGVARAADWPAGWKRMRPEELPPEAFFRLANELDRRPRAPMTRQV